MEKPSCTILLPHLCSYFPSQGNHETRHRTTRLHRCIAICENLPFNGLLDTQLEVIALYSHEHKGDCAPTECISSRFNKASTLLIRPVHSWMQTRRWDSCKLVKINTDSPNERMVGVCQDWPNNVDWTHSPPRCRVETLPVVHDLHRPISSWCCAWTDHILWKLLLQVLEKPPVSIRFISFSIA